MAGPLLLVALPPSGVTLVALRGGQSIHVQPLEDSPHPRRADIDVVVALEVHPDLQRAEVVLLAQVDDLLDDVGMGDRRAVQRSAGAVLEALQALVFVSALPPVEDVAADAVVAASACCSTARRRFARRIRSFSLHTRSAMRLPSLGAQTVNNLSQF